MRADESWLRKAAKGFLDKASPTPPLYGEMAPPSESLQDAHRLPLHHRYESIIDQIEGKMILRFPREHYLEELTAECLRCVASKEGRSGVAPYVRESLSAWRARTAVPRDYDELASYVRERFGRRYVQLVQLGNESDRAAEQRWQADCEQWLSRNSALLRKFLEIADRKVSRLDEYGDENWDALPHEIHTFLLKMVKTMNDGMEELIRDALKKRDGSILPGKYRWLKSRLETEFRTFHQNRASQTNTTEFTSLSGTDFEIYLARLLKQNGFEDIQGTAATGDQGADLIAKKDDKTIVIQAKRYQGSVGNKAVQEVVAAVKFYRADEGWVITSGTFTPSAKSLAQANNVKLIDGYTIRKGCFD